MTDLDRALWDLCDHAGYTHKIRDIYRIGPHSATIRIPPGEFLVFTDRDHAEKAAVECLVEFFEDDPPVGPWAEQFYAMSDSHKRCFAGDNHEDVWEMDLEEAIEEADLADELEEKLQPFQDEIDRTEDDDEIDYDEYQAAQEAYDDARDELVEDLGGQAREQIHEDRVENTLSELRSDPIGYFQDHYGYTMSEIIEYGHMTFHDEKAAQHIIDQDGAGSQLSGYDGDEIELDHGGVAYRTD
jgi:hypothetical protein